MFWNLFLKNNLFFILMLVENEKLVLTEVKTPEVKADEIRIKIKAIGPSISLPHFSFSVFGAFAKP